MKTVTFLLLFANLGLFAWFYFGAGRTSDEPQLMDQQLNPQAIRLLRADQLAALATERTKQTVERAKPPPKANVAACLELGAFNPGDAARVQLALEPLALGSRLSQRRAEEIASYWVVMPPQRNRQAANQKAAELKKLGVEDACSKPRRQRGRGSQNCAKRAFERPGSIHGKHPCRKSIFPFVRSPRRCSRG